MYRGPINSTSGPATGTSAPVPQCSERVTTFFDNSTVNLSAYCFHFQAQQPGRNILYFIDLSMRTIEQGYADSLALIAGVIGVEELNSLAATAREIMLADPEGALELLDGILADAEGIAYDHGYLAFTRDGTCYVMTENEEDCHA